MGYGWVIFKRESIVAQGFGMFAQRKNATSCISEYLALIEGLEALADLRVQFAPVEIRGDAKSVINQMQGFTRINSTVIRNLQRQALKIAKHFNQLSWAWIPRRENRYADMLSRHAVVQTGATSGKPTHLLNQAQSKLFTSGRLIPLMDLRVYTNG